MNTIFTEQEYKLIIAEIRNLENNSVKDISEIKSLSAAAMAYEQVKYDFTGAVLHQAS